MGKTIRFGAKYPSKNKKPENINEKEAWLKNKASHKQHEYYDKTKHNQHDRSNKSKISMDGHFEKKHIWPIRPENKKGPKI